MIARGEKQHFAVTGAALLVVHVPAHESGHPVDFARREFHAALAHYLRRHFRAHDVVTVHVPRAAHALRLAHIVQQRGEAHRRRRRRIFHNFESVFERVVTVVLRGLRQSVQRVQFGNYIFQQAESAQQRQSAVMRAGNAVFDVRHKNLHQFVALAPRRDVREQRRACFCRFSRLFLNVEAGFGGYAGKAHEAQSVRRKHLVRIVRAQNAARRILRAAQRVYYSFFRNVVIYAVGGEIAAERVLLQRGAERHLFRSMAAARRVLLAAERRVLSLRALYPAVADQRRSHALISRREIEPARQNEFVGHGGAGYVHVRRRQSAQRVADKAAHEVHGRPAAGGELFQPFRNVYFHKFIISPRRVFFKSFRPRRIFINCHGIFMIIL